MQIKSTVRLHFISVRMAVIKKTRLTVLIKMWTKGSPCALLIEVHTGTAAVENSMDIPQSIKNRMTYDPAIQQCSLVFTKSKISFQLHQHKPYNDIISYKRRDK